MTNWRSSAAYRIAFLNFLAFVAGLALLGAVTFIVMHAAFMRQLDAMIADEAQAIAQQYHAGGSQELAEVIQQREVSPSPARMSYAVFSPDGRRTVGNLHAVRPDLGLHDIHFIDPREGDDVARAVTVDLSPSERLVVAADREWIERIDSTVIVIFSTAFIAACAAGLAGALVLGAFLRRRLSAINRTAEAIIRGDIRQRMPISARDDEFDELGATLNRMLDRIEGLLENLRQVSNDVAHDLRTPLARLRTKLERGVVEHQRGVSSGALLEEAIDQVDDVLRLFAAILRIAEIESGETRRFFAKVDLSQLIQDLAESYSPAISDDGRTLTWSIEPDLFVDGDRELLAQAVINLLENAARHTPVGTIIRLTAVRADELACISVTDNGPGVPADEIGRIVKRFARSEDSRSKPGHGLGLNLVCAIARLHGGRLDFRDAAPGLNAIIELHARTSSGAGASTNTKE